MRFWHLVLANFEYSHNLFPWQCLDVLLIEVTCQSLLGVEELAVTWTDILVQISVYSSLTLIAPKFVLHSQLLHQLYQPLQHTLVLSSDQ